MGFHEIRFPTNVSFGSSGGPERRTEIVTLSNGHEERNTPWAHSRRRYDAGPGMRSAADIEMLISFFEARRGRLHGFRWKDWTDWRSSGAARPVGADDQVIGIGDGVMTTFELQKAYASGASTYFRPIAKPVAGSVVVAVDAVAMAEGAGWELDAANGRVSLVVPPAQGAVVTAGFEFDVPVRFDTDLLQISVAAFGAGDVPAVPIIEVRS